MKVNQIATILTDMYKEATGETSIVKEDLTGIVDTGITLANIGEKLLESGVDNYVKSLMNRIGKVVYSGRAYKSTAPNIEMDSWEYGSVLAKVRCEVGDYKENKSWNLEKGKSYDPFIFSPPTATAKFYNNKSTFELQISFTELQVKESFNSPSELANFFSIIEQRIALKKELAIEMMTMRTIVNMIATKISKNNGVVNLRSLYYQSKGVDIENSLENCETGIALIQNPDFLRFAYKTIALYRSYLSKPNMNFNVDGYVTFTPEDEQKIILLSEFATSCDTYLLSNTYHKDLVKLEGYSTVPYWQGTGKGTIENPPYSNYNNITGIDVKTFDGTNVTATGIIGVIFDKKACAICNRNDRVTSQYVASAEFTNFWHKFDCSYLNDFAENCVVFVID